MRKAKKLFRYVAYFLIIILVCGLISNFLGLDINSTSDSSFGEEIKTSNDDMLLDDGEFMLALNQTAMQSYFNSNLTSKNELEEIYSGAKIKLETSEDKAVITDALKLYICVSNNYGNSMYIYGYAWFNDSNELIRIKFEWYNGVNIVDAMSTGSIKIGTSYKCFVGNALFVNSKSALALTTSIEGEKQYMNLDTFYNKSQIRELCNSIFTDLFVVQKCSSDDNTNEDIFNGNSVQNIDIAYLNHIYEGRILWDTAAWGTNPYEEIYNSLYDTSLEDEGAQEIQDALIFKYTYTNKSTLHSKVFYLVVDIKLNYVGLTLFENNEYTLIWYKGTDGSYVSTTLYYDLTNYSLLEAVTFLGKSIVYDSSTQSMFSESSKLVYGENSEEDFPWEIYKFIGYNELENLVFKSSGVGQKYYIYDVMVNLTDEFVVNDNNENTYESYWELDEQGYPMYANDCCFDDISFEKGKVYVINVSQLSNLGIEYESSELFYKLYNTSDIALQNEGHFIQEFGLWSKWYNGKAYESTTDIEEEIASNFYLAVREKIGRPDNNVSYDYWAERGTNIVIIPASDFTLSYTHSDEMVEMFNEYPALCLEVAEATMINVTMD